MTERPWTDGSIPRRYRLAAREEPNIQERTWTDTDRLDALENFVRDNHYLLLHRNWNPHHLTGLSVAHRTLREAIDALAGVPVEQRGKGAQTDG